MPVYDAQVNEQIGGDKAELFASIVRKARVQVDQEKVKLWLLVCNNNISYAAYDICFSGLYRFKNLMIFEKKASRLAC